jgi:hypothetical protein
MVLLFFWLAPLHDSNFKQAERRIRVPCPEKDEVRAVITGFSKSGDIAFTTNTLCGTITFMVTADVWFGQGTPTLDQIVILSQISKFQRGWRAATARDVTLADE